MISPFLQKLMFVRQFNINNGKVSVLGDNYVLLDSLALLEIQKIDQTRLYEVMKESSFRNISEAVKFAKYAKVYKNVREAFMERIAKLGGRIGKTDQGALMTLKELFNIYGLGSLEISKLDNEKKQALVRITGSTIAEDYKKKYGKSANPVDSIASGILAGMFSYLFKKQVDCIEEKCSARGDSFCEFAIG